MAVFEEDDYPGWAYLLLIFSFGLLKKPIEWIVGIIDKRKAEVEHEG